MTAAVLSLTNEILTAAIVIVAASMLLYNLWRNLRDRVARTSGAVLACVTIAYTADVFISLNPNQQGYEAALRLQWLGLAFIPAALFHLSDALLATTGRPSRGRRRLGVRILYAVSTVFVLLVAFSDLLIQVVPTNRFGVNAASLRAGVLFPVYVAYFLSATGLAFINVQRARKRCLTRSTRRRMGYLQAAMLTPAIGTFPYSVLIGSGSESSVLVLVLVNIANAIVVLMLIFLSYPLSFFGSRVPDRVVKSELLSFFVRGPGTGLIVLATILLSTQTTRILGIETDAFLPFAIVAVVLMWQWSVAIVLPSLESALIYGDEDSAQLNKLRNMNDRLLSRSDLLQLMDAQLRAICDYLQVNTAFVVQFVRKEDAHIVAEVGPNPPAAETVQAGKQPIVDMLTNLTIIDTVPLRHWETYWVAPLFSLRLTDENGAPTLIGVLGICARAESIDLTDDEYNRLKTFVRRLERTLDDLGLQSEIYAALEGLLPQFSMTRTRAAEVEYLPPRTESAPKPPTLPDHEQLVEQVKAALRQYWGGPGLTRSRLLELYIVRDCMEQTNNPAHALRAVLQDAIDSQRPEGERKTTDPEWTIYNILDMRFVQGSKVSDVARKLAIAESSLYRRQRDAIEAVATALERMERERWERETGDAS